MLMLFAVTTVSAQFSNGYTFRKRIEIDNSQVAGTQSLQDFPVLVNITNSDLRSSTNGGFVENLNGYDIIFTAADGTTQLNHQLESYNPNTGEVSFWVNVSSLQAQNNTYIYLYYGNSSISSDQSNPGTWNNNYQLVQHYNNDFLDATANGNDGTNNGTSDIAGQILRARDYNGSNNFVEVADDPSLSITNQITISMWMYGDDFSNTPDLVTKGEYTQAYSTWVRSQQTVRFAINSNSFTSNSTISTGTWNHLTFTYDQSQWKIFINGNQDNSGSFTDPINDPNNTPLFVSTSSSDYPLDGRVDEVRISNTARSANWVETEFNNQNNPGSFLSVVNDPPVLSNIEPLAKAYNTGSPPITITSEITVDDYDDANIQSATVQITSNQGANDVLAFTNQNGISASWNSSTGTLTLSGSASAADYQAALRSVTFENTSGSPSQPPRTISFQVDDGTTSSSTVSRQIYIPSINDLSADISNVVFQFSGLDVDGDNQTTDQPASGTTVNPWGDRSDAVSGSADYSFSNGTAAERSQFFDNSAAMGEEGALLYDGTDDFYTRGSENAINTATFDQKSFALVFRTSDDISSDQVIYKQGAGIRGYLFGIFNGDLYAYTWNTAEWQAGDQYKSINLGSVQRHTSYTVIASHDATAGNLADRTWSANVNGGSIQTLNNVDVQESHTGAPEIGTSNDALDPINDQSLSGANFQGYIAEVVSWNQAFSSALFSEVYNILDQRWSNVPPQISGIETSDLNYAEGDPATTITSALSISDSDNTVMDSALVSISNNFVGSEDVLNFTNQNGITGSYNNSTGELFLSGTSSISNYQSALQSITFENTNNVNPSTNKRTIAFKAYDWDDPSNTQSRDITITPVNSAPSLSNIESTVFNYTEGDGAAPTTSSITIGDQDNSNMQSATVQISGNYAQGQDILAFSDANGITSSFNSSTGTLTLTGSSSIANYESALRAVTYNNISSTPNTANRTFTFTINDGTDGSNTQSRDFSITKINDAPVLANIESSALSYQANDPPSVITDNITVSDADDANIENATVEITSGFENGEDVLAFSDILGITGSYNNTTGVLSLTGTATKADYETALQSVTYENTNSSPATQPREVTFTVNDGNDNSNTQSRNISLNIVQSISGLDLWLRGDKGVITSGSEVTTWEDQSGNNHDFTGIADAGTRPSFASSVGTLNNKDAVQLAGDGDYLEDADGENFINGCSEFTIFYVIQSDQINTNRGFWNTQVPDGQDDIFTLRYDAQGANAGAQNLIKAGILADNPDHQLESFSDIQTTEGQILSLDWQSGNEFNLIVNGVLNNPSGISAPPSGTISNAATAIVGKGGKDDPDSNNQSWDGYVAEVAFYCRYLSSSERKQIEDYLSEKYDIAIRLITPATNGEAIPADNFATGTYTTLNGPRLREGTLGELVSGETITLKAPSGFEWNTSASPTASVSPAYGSNTTLQISSSPTNITTSEITFTVNQESDNTGNPGEVSFSGLEVRPTQGTLPNTGTITNTGTTGPGGTTNYGTLKMVAGAADSLNFSQQPSITTVNQPITPAVEVQLVDQFGNAVKNSGTNISAALTSGTGTLSGTTTRSTNVKGKAFFDDLSIDQTGTKNLTASSTGLTSAVSNNFDIINASDLASFNIESVSGGNIVTQTAGQSFDIKITAIDGTGSTKTDFNGTVEVSSTANVSNGAGTTANFTNGVLSSHSVTILNTGNFNITAINSNGSQDGISNSFDVNPGTPDETTSVISANPTFIASDGTSTSTITVQLRDSEDNNLTSGGHNIQLSTNAGSLSGVTDNSDGTYSATLTSSTNSETATITGTVNGNTITDNAEVRFSQFDAIWEGSLGGGPSAERWTNTDNWNNNAVPGTNDIVLIPENPAVGNKYPIVQNSDQTIGNLVVEQNADVTVGSNNTLTVNNELTGNGEVNGPNTATLQVGGDLTISSLQIGNVILNGGSLQQIKNVNHFNNLEIDNSSNVSVDQNIFVNGTLTLTSGNLIMPSGLNLIAKNQSVTSGAITFRRELTGVKGWRMISSPVASTYDDLLDGIITQGYSGAFYDADVAPNDTLQPNVLWYVESYEGTDNQRWRTPSNASDALTEGRGLFVYVFGDIPVDSRYNQPLPDTLEVTGPEFTGNGSEVNLNVTYTATADTGWNLVGNPYGATLNWNDNTNWTKTNVDQTIYVWDPNANGGNGNFLTWNGTVGSLGSGLIAPFQGFWVKANAQNPQLKVSEDNKTTNGIFRRKEQQKAPTPNFTLQLEGQKLRGIKQEAYVMFSDQAKRGRDPKDGYRMFPFGQNFLELYFKQHDGSQMSIQNLPEEFDHRYELPFDVGGVIDGESYDGVLTLSWPKIKALPSDWIITLTDNKTGKKINLRNQTFYTFNQEKEKAKATIAKRVNDSPSDPIVLLDPASQPQPLAKSKSSAKTIHDKTRFTLTITTQKIESNTPDKFLVKQNYPNPFGDKTTIKFGLPNKNRVTVEIFDILGRRVRTLASDEVYPAGFHEIPWNPSQLASGVYLYRVRTQDKAITKKLTFIK